VTVSHKRRPPHAASLRPRPGAGRAVAPAVHPSAPVIPLFSHCSTCNLHGVCLPAGLSHLADVQLDAAIASHRRLKHGQVLFRAGDPFENIYAVRGGFFKTTVLSEDGREQVTGFQMAGDLLGLDGLSTERHTSDAVALDLSEVCVIPYPGLQRVLRDSEEVQCHFCRILGAEIVRDQEVMLLLGTMSAEERVAAFLLNFSHRLVARGYSPAEFQLRMTRKDIGSYLGLKLETVSRTFSRLHELALIEADRRQVRILDSHGLTGIVGHHASALRRHAKAMVV
jgi:CRP/FNR family transcriptional regulator, anaerobic regulatory protein